MVNRAARRLGQLAAEGSLSVRLWYLAWDSLRTAILNSLSFGARSRRFRTRRIAAGEVIVVEPSMTPDKNADSLVRLARKWFMGTARARTVSALHELDFTREVLLEGDVLGPDTQRRDATRSLPRMWLLHCRPGHEHDLARRLRRLIFWMSRRLGRSADTLPIVVQVPLVHLETTSAPGNLDVTGCTPRGPVSGARWSPTMGLVDTDIYEQALAALPGAPRVTWLGTLIDGGINTELRLSTVHEDRRPRGHGTAICAIAGAQIPLQIESVGYHQSALAEPEMQHVSGAVIIHGLEALQMSM